MNHNVDKRMKLSERVGWKRKFAAYLHILLDALRKFDQDHGFFLSSGITFNLLICLIPIVLLFFALVGTYLYSDQEVLNHIRQYFENSFPSLDPRIMKNILRIIQDRKIVGILGIGGLIWTSTWVFSSLRTALNMVFEVKKGRNIIRGKVIDLFMILLAGIFLLLSMVFTSLVTVIPKYHFRSFPEMSVIFRFILKYPIPFLFTFWMFFLIYKIIPNKKIHFKTALQASFFTSLLWEIAKQIFAWYVLHIGRFSMIYGSLSTLAIFFLWIYYSSAVLILGGEVASLMERERAKVAN